MTSESRACPMCTEQMEHDGDHEDLACPNCGLCAPESVIDALVFNHRQLDEAVAEVERLKQPAHVLAETVKLLNAVEVVELHICGDGDAFELVQWDINAAADDADRVTYVHWSGCDVADVYAKAKAARNG